MKRESNQNMRKIFFPLCSGLLFASFVGAAEQPEQNLSIEKNNPNRFYFGPEFLCYDMNVHVKDIRVHGARFFWGVRLGYEYLKPSAFYAGIDLMGTGSGVDFKASKNGHGLSWHRADRGFGNLEARFGYTFSPTNWMITPFLGVGMYNVYAIDHHNHQGFEENLPYATLGVRNAYAFTLRFSLGFDLKVFHTYAADQRFKFRGGEKKTHHNNWGGEFGVPFLWRIGASRRWDIELEPYFLKLASSETQNIYGTRLLFGYRF